MTAMSDSPGMRSNPPPPGGSVSSSTATTDLDGGDSDNMGWGGQRGAGDQERAGVGEEAPFLPRPLGELEVTSSTWASQETV